MHRVHVFAITAMFMLAAGIWGCAGSADTGRRLPPTIATVQPVKGYLKKVAVTLIRGPQSAMGRKMGELFFDTLVRSIREEDAQLLIVTPDKSGFPAFMSRLGEQPAMRVNAVDLAADGRRAGYNGLITAAVRGIRPYTRKGGILWFRKVRYFISFDLTVDLYDPLTAAKIVGVVEEASIEVSDIEYDAFQEGITTDVEELREEIVEFGKQIGELVAESFEDLFWGISVVKVEGSNAYLPAGSRSGLTRGVKLAVFEGRRMIEGLGNERFIVPGPQVQTIQISSVGPDDAEAVVINGGTVQVGDIAVPVK